VTQLKFEDVLKLLGVDELPGATSWHKRFLEMSTERLLQEKEEAWIKRHCCLLLDQYEYLRGFL